MQSKESQNKYVQIEEKICTIEIIQKTFWRWQRERKKDFMDALQRGSATHGPRDILWKCMLYLKIKINFKIGII